MKVTGITAEQHMRAHGLKPEEDAEYLQILKALVLEENDPVDKILYPTLEQGLKALKVLRQKQT